MTSEERLKLRDFLFTKFKDEKIIFKNKRFISIRSYGRLESLLEFNDKLKTLFDSYVNEFRNKEEALYCLLHNDDIDNYYCPVCNDKCSFDPNKKRYGKTCGSKKCKKELVARTNVKKYGYSSPMKSPLIRNKAKQSMLERYGVEHSAQSEEIEARRKQTNIERYGYEYPTKSKIVMEKIRHTNREKYGCDYVLQNQDVKDKVEATMIERYGVAHPLQSPEIKEKMKVTNLERYGSDNPFGNPEIREKIIETHLEKYGVEYITQKNITNYDIWVNDELLVDFIKNEYEKKGYFLTLGEIKSYFNVGLDTMHERVSRLNLEEYFYIQSSNLETDFLYFLNSNNINLLKSNIHNRNLIKGNTEKSFLELDFTIPNTNIAIEINDIASHNSLNPDRKQYKHKYYHHNKTINARKANLRLLHLWEWELRNEEIWARLSKWLLWLFKNHSLKELSSDSNKVLNIKVIKDSNKEKEFLNSYNVYGYTKSDICISLYYGNEMLSMLNFKELDEVNKTYQLLRMACNYSYRFNLLYYKLLLNYFKSSFNHSKLLVYNHLDKDESYLFKQLSFSLEFTEDPKPIYCNKKLNISYINQPGYIPIYDCGMESYYLSFD